MRVKTKHTCLQGKRMSAWYIIADRVENITNTCTTVNAAQNKCLLGKLGSKFLFPRNQSVENSRQMMPLYQQR